MRFARYQLSLTLLFVAFVALCLFATPPASSLEGAAEEASGRRNSASENIVGDDDGSNEDVNKVNNNFEEEEEDEDDELAYSDERTQPAFARAIFPKCADILSPTTNAGSTLDAVIAYRNAHSTHKQTLVLVTGHLTPINTHNYVLQNFSIVRHVRHVNPTETVTIQYSFTPDEQLEADDYNLVLGVYYHDDTTNTTHLVAAFNGTMTVDEPLGVDPKTVLTYFTLLAIFGGVVYLLASKTGLVAALRSLRGGGDAASGRRVEVGTNGEAYDPDYISDEHLKYKNSVLRRTSPPILGKKIN